MKLLITLCVLTFVVVISARQVPELPYYYPRGCVYVEGKCQSGCPEGTTSYTAPCGPITPEATCDEPHPQESRGAVCDYSSCHCNSPTVRDSISGKCVALENCPKKTA